MNSMNGHGTSLSWQSLITNKPRPQLRPDGPTLLGLMTFGNDGNVAASAKVLVKELNLVGVSLNVRFAGLVARHRSFLDYHRSEVWMR